MAVSSDLARESEIRPKAFVLQAQNMSQRLSADLSCFSVT